MVKSYIDFKFRNKSQKEYNVIELKKNINKQSSLVTAKEYNDNICLDVNEKGTPFLDDDPDEYLKFYVGS